jgi:hypothetical protein
VLTSVIGIREATLIVRARAIGADTGASTRSGRVAFKVVEVLKAPAGTKPRRLVVDGTLSDRDDFTISLCRTEWCVRRGEPQPVTPAVPRRRRILAAVE